MDKWLQAVSTLNAMILDRMLWEKLTERFMDSELLKKGVDEYLRLQNGNMEDQEHLRIMELIARLDEEEKRYAKAYGTGSLQFKSYQALISDLNKRREGLERQLQIVKNRRMERAVDITPEELYNEAHQVIKSLDFSDKHKTVRDLVDKVIIKERSGIEVWAHLSLQSVQKLGYEPISRYSGASERWKEYVV